MDNTDEISQHAPQSDQFDEGKRLASEQGMCLLNRTCNKDWMILECHSQWESSPLR